MGLDQYAYKVKKSAIVNDLKFEEEIDGKNSYEEIYYWRKVPNLQGWMEDLYREKGGEKVFDCEYVRLELEDLTRLENDVLNKNLPETEGFFFGEHREEDMKDVLDFVKIARDVIKDGYAVYYSSWW